MSDVLRELLELLRLERLEQNLFRGQSQDLGWGNVFGGQVIGQALSAAEKTVPEGRSAHSLHGYFLRFGDASKPIIYDVDCIRDGKSFNTRRVVAIQNGRAIFNMSASFQKQEDGYDHQTQMPDAPEPDSLLSEPQLAAKHAERVPKSMRDLLTAEKPIEMKPVNPVNPLEPVVRPAHWQVWCRAIDELPDEPSIHQYLLAYASDFYLLGCSMLPHGVSLFSPGMQVASVDHAIWFHRPFRMDDWLLYDVESPSASGARGLARGRYFSRDGTLVASTMQEGLIRQWPA